MPFSSTKFLKTIENQRIKSVKLYQILLILVRTLFILFLVLSFARPTIKSMLGDVSGNAQTTAVIVLDDSYSMQSFTSSQTYMEIAAYNLQNLLSVFKPQDKVFLLSGDTKKPLRVSAENKQSVLKRVKSSNYTLDLESLFIEADSIFEENVNLNNELYFLSDFKIADNAKFKNYDFKTVNNFKAYKINLAENMAFKNVSIDSIKLNNQLIEVGKTINFSVFITNHDESGDMETNLNLYKEDIRVAMNYVSLKSGESKKIDIQYLPQQTGMHYMSLQIDEDDLSADNKYYFSLFLKEKIKALLVSSHAASELSFAVKILAQNSLFEIDHKMYSEWFGTNINTYDLLILDNPGRNDSPVIEKLTAYLDSKKSIIIIPGETLTQQGYNKFFQQLGSGIRFDNLNQSGKNSFFSLEKEKTSNSVFDALFRDKKSSFSPPKLFKYFKQTGFDNSLINLSNNNTFLSKSGRLFVFSSSFSGNWSNFKISGLFLPLLHRAFYLAAQTKNSLSGTSVTGETITFSSEGRNIENSFFIKAPQKEKFSVIPKSVQNKLYFNGGIAVNPGFYILLENKAIIESIAVNHSAHELQKPFIKDSSFGFELTTISTDQMNQQILTARTGFELWLIFLVLALAMLLAEMIIIKKIEGLPLFK